jgi:type III secretion system-like peptide-binding chaperone
MDDDRQIDVSAMAVRQALANSFTSVERGDHAWRGTVGLGDVVVTADVRLGGGRPYVQVSADCCPAGPLDGDLARLLVIESAETVMGRFALSGDTIRVEHAILAGTTMASVEVQATVWTVGWTAHAFAPRLLALMARQTPPPPAPETPAALRRDAADHVRMTTERVRRFLAQRFGDFQHDPNWGFHGAFGSARVFVDVLPVLEDSTAVRASSPVLSDVDLSDELAVRLVELAAESPFGSFSYMPTRREVWFEQVILGDDLDQVELESAIEVVAEVADGSDDALAAAFGGRRYADLG